MRPHSRNKKYHRITFIGSKCIMSKSTLLPFNHNVLNIETKNTVTHLRVDLRRDASIE